MVYSSRNMNVGSIQLQCLRELCHWREKLGPLPLNVDIAYSDVTMGELFQDSLLPVLGTPSLSHSQEASLLFSKSLPVYSPSVVARPSGASGCVPVHS